MFLCHEPEKRVSTGIDVIQHQPEPQNLPPLPARAFSLCLSPNITKKPMDAWYPWTIHSTDGARAKAHID
ncbi:hypothetical protein VTH06DRAFT_327 [Thermothelomyces fergusii]